MLARKIGKCNADQTIKDKKNYKNHIKGNIGQIVSNLKSDSVS